MLIHIPDLQEFIAELPEDPLTALGKFEAMVRSETIHRSDLQSNEEAAAQRSYAVYMHGYLDEHHIDIEGRHDPFKIEDDRLEYYASQLQEKIQAVYMRHKIASAFDAKKSLTSRLVIDEAFKSEVRHYVDQIKRTIEEADITQSKRDELFKKLNEFVAALDQGRSWWEKFNVVLWAFKVEAVENVDWALTSLERLEKVMTKMAKTIKSLPAPENAEQIEGPPKQIEGPDDETKEDAAD